MFTRGYDPLQNRGVNGSQVAFFRRLIHLLPVQNCYHRRQETVPVIDRTEDKRDTVSHCDEYATTLHVT